MSNYMPVIYREEGHNRDLCNVFIFKRRIHPWIHFAYCIYMIRLIATNKAYNPPREYPKGQIVNHYV